MLTRNRREANDGTAKEPSGGFRVARGKYLLVLFLLFLFLAGSLHIFMQEFDAVIVIPIKAPDIVDAGFSKGLTSADETMSLKELVEWLDLDRQTKRHRDTVLEYHYFPRECEERSRFTFDRKRKLECASNSASTFFKNGTLRTCGGFPMEHGKCFLYNTGWFAYSKNTKMVLPSKKVPGNSDEFWSGEIPMHLNRMTPICENMNGWASKARVDIDGNLKFKACNLISLDPLNLVKNFAGKRLVFFGASHIRNIMTGMMAAIRNQRIVIELHEDTETKERGVISRYEVSVSGDRLDLDVDAVLARLEDGSGHQCATTPGSECFIVYNLWSPYFKTQTEHISNILPKIDAHYIITSITPGHEPHNDLPIEWQKTWIEYLQLHKTKVEHFLYWSWRRGNERTPRIEKTEFWLHQNVSSVVRDFTLGLYSTVHDVVAHSKGVPGIIQLHRMYHSICIVRDNFHARSSVTYKIEAYEQCTGTIDKVLAKASLGFFLVHKTKG